MGGGGFTMEAEPSVLDDYVLSLAPAREPRICLLPTAGGDSEEQIRRFRIAFGDRLCVPTALSLFRLAHEPVPLREHLLSQDVIYVGGGSMINLLALWRAHGLDAILRDAWPAGIVLAGLSAGSMCWFEGGITTSLGRPAPAAGLGFLPGSNSVHYDGEPERRPAYLAPRHGVLRGYGVARRLLFRGTRLAEVVAARPRVRAYRVDAVEGVAREHELEPRVLSEREHDRRRPRCRTTSASCACCVRHGGGWRVANGRRLSRGKVGRDLPVVTGSVQRNAGRRRDPPYLRGLRRRAHVALLAPAGANAAAVRSRSARVTSPASPSTRAGPPTSRGTRTSAARPRCGSAASRAAQPRARAAARSRPPTRRSHGRS